MATPTPLAALGGITYGQAKTTIARVVDNGVCDDDPRVLERTNEAQKMLLDALIPVGGMATYDVVADGTTLLLPPQLENAIEVEVRGNALVNNQSDIKQGWYDLINNFTYVDPDQQHDQPLTDLFLHPDPLDPSILRRKYDFIGLTQGATVRVTGAKRYVPITSDNDYLIIQNVRAIKMAVQSLERTDINDIDNGQKYYQAAIGMLKAEVTKHLLDPRNSLKRRAQYEKDLATYQTNSFGWVRARLALEIPGILAKGKSEITGMLEMAEMRLIGKGLWKGTVEEFHAEVVNGLIKLPTRVDSVLMARLDGWPIDVRSIFFGYMKNGPGHLTELQNICSRMLSDEGEVYDVASQLTRRQYRLTGACTNGSCLSMACKLRWIAKQPEDQMVIKNFEALRLMTTAINLEESEKWQEAAQAAGLAVNEVEKETREYIGGQEMVPHVELMGGGIGGYTYSMDKRKCFAECLDVATKFVAARRAEAPEGYDPKNLDIGNIFGSKPKVIKKKVVTPTEEAGKAIAGNIQNIPDITKLGDLYSASELEQLNKIIPGFSDNLTAGGAATKTLLGNAQSYLSGEIPQDVQDAVQRSSAYTALRGGYAGSPMAGALTARDLGLTSLDLQKTGANMLGQGLNSAQGWDSLSRRNMLDPGSMMVSSGMQLGQANIEAMAQQQYRQNQANIAAQPDPLAKGIFDSTMQTIGMVLSIYGGGGGYKPQQAQAAQPNFNQGMYGTNDNPGYFNPGYSQDVSAFG